MTLFQILEWRLLNELRSESYEAGLWTDEGNCFIYNDEGVRKIVVKNFLIYFWVDDENIRVQVTAVIYQRRDQLARLADMEWD